MGSRSGEDHQGVTIIGWRDLECRDVGSADIPLWFRTTVKAAGRPRERRRANQRQVRSVAGWVLMVAMPGTTWTRGTISN